MNPEQKRLCMGCMAPMEEQLGTCPRCGYDNGRPGSGEFLLPGTILARRYLVGKLVSQNGEGAFYLGYDQEEERKVWVSEYAPDTLCRRNETTGAIAPRSGREAQYKSLMYDFIENAQILRGLKQSSSGGLVPVLDMVGTNGTAYTIYRYIEAKPLLEYMKENGGTLPWPRVKPMMVPLCKSLLALHGQGAIHRGVAPQTLYVDAKGRLWLRGMAISAARTGMSELCCELFEGYSAPEQYSATGRQGAWTDVYSCAAVLYRMLTGTVPVSGEIRKEKDTLYPANMANSAVPSDVSVAIDAAMLVNVDRRTNGMESFIAELLEEIASNTAVFESGVLPVPSQGGGQARRQAASASSMGDQYRRPGKKMPFWLRTMLTTCIVLGAVMTVLCLTVLRPLLFPAQSSGSESTSSESVVEESSEPEAELMPDFRNRYVKSVTENSLYSEKFHFVVREEYNEDGVPNGYIASQSVQPNQPVPEDGIIILTVSRGSQITTMPDLVGSSVEFAKRTLDDLNIRYQVITQKAIEGLPGVILRTSIAAGEQVVRDRDTVYLTIKEPDMGDASSESSSTIGDFTIDVN